MNNLIILVSKSTVEAIEPKVINRMMNWFGGGKPFRVWENNPIDSLKVRRVAVYDVQSLTICQAHKPEFSRGFNEAGRTISGGKNVS